MQLPELLALDASTKQSTALEVAISITHEMAKLPTTYDEALLGLYETLARLMSHYALRRNLNLRQRKELRQKLHHLLDQSLDRVYEDVVELYDKHPEKLT